MSKSKGEFLTVSLLEEKGYDPLVYRLFCLQSHYRKALVFTWENLDNAKTAYDKLISRIAALKEGGDVDEAAAAELRNKFKAALDNDLNTSLAVTALYDVLKAKTNDATTGGYTVTGEGDPEVDAKVLARAEAKKAKNFAEADRIRDELKAQGIEITDVPGGAVWKRI